MIFKKIQNHLEALYRLSFKVDVEHFLVSRKRASANTTFIKNRLGQEALIIRQEGWEVELGLFVANPVLKELEKRDPFVAVDEKNLKPLCVAVEGVSHFLYLVKNLEENHPVTQLELELQAEIDKYLLASLLFYHQTGGVPEFLLHHLFENFHWDPSLSKPEKKRYAEANRLGAKFCTHLEQNHIRHGRWQKALEAARHFYHLDHWSKIRQLTP